MAADWLLLKLTSVRGNTSNRAESLSLPMDQSVGLECGVIIIKTHYIIVVEEFLADKK